ncbi:MAG: gliding motility-associated C-terminal domain-containing protein [Bacteroidales bacterium]|nr:gliding motility-associated C-terminal domain-containing protein [Bacteroidales bacterium]
MNKNTPTTIKSQLIIILFFILAVNISQTAAQPFYERGEKNNIVIEEKDKGLEEIPERFKQHPEYGLVKLQNPDMQDSYELIHERTVDSRLFQNLDGGFTIEKGGQPMHYKDENGWWRTIVRELEEDDVKPHLFHMRKQAQPISFDAKTACVTMSLNETGQSISYGKTRSFIQFDSHWNKISERATNSFLANVNKVEAFAEADEVFPGIDLNLSFHSSRVKSNYTISSPNLINSASQWVVFSEEIEIPAGFELSYADVVNSGSDIFFGDLVIKNTLGEETARINQPVFSDSGNDRATNNIEGAYKFTQTGPNTYLIYIVIPSSWLLNPARVYPVVIDPAVTTNSGSVVNSCYFPTYQSSNLAITVPAGTITNTYLRWDFRAVDATIGWLEDQRSYVSGPNGSTSVFIGSGAYSGLQIYTTNSTIANNNAHPGGNINFTFYASRVWGGSGCNNTYNYLEYRYISVTYYTSTCNNFQNFHSNVNSTGYAPCGSWATTSTIGPGQHQLHYAYYGSSYSINTCGTYPTFDSQITAYQGGSSVVYYNDDAGTSCSSNGLTGNTLDSWIDWTAPFNGWVQIQVTRYNCFPWTAGVGSAILRIRENAPPQPSTPTLNPPGGSYCAGANVLLETVGNPPVGVTWYWQTSSTGVSTTNSGSSFTVTNSGTYYLRPRTGSGCWGTASAGVTVTFYPGISNNSISANQTICSGTSPATIVGSTPSGGLGAGTYNYGWQQSTDGGLTWVNSPAPNTGISYSPINLTTTTRYKRWVQSGPCPASESNVIIITVQPVITAGTIASNQSICYNTSPAAFTGTAASGGNGTYTYQWQHQAGCTGAWSDISGATAITYNFTGNLTSNSCYRRFVTAGVCPGVNSNTITVTVYPDLTPGSVAANQSICYNTSPSAFTSTALPTGGTGSYNYQWQLQPLCNGGWADITSAVASTYNFTGNLTQTTCYRRQVKSGTCGPVYSNTITVTVYGDLQAGSVAANQSICYNSTPSAFTNTALASGGDGGYTYQWQQQPGCTGSWTNISGATSTTYHHTNNLIQTTCFRRRVINTCGTVYTSTIILTVYPEQIPGTIGINQSICYNTSPAAFTNIQVPTGGTGPITYQWQQQPGCTGTWSNISGATSSTYDYTGNLTQTTCYRRSTTNTCGSANSFAVTVTVYPDLSAGTIGSNQTICAGQTINPFTSITNAAGGSGNYTYQWQMTSVAGCASGWTNIPGTNSNVYAHTGLLPQTTCFRRQVTETCSGPINSNTITVTVNPLPVLSITGLGNTYCIDQTSAVPIVGLPTGGAFTGSGIQGNDFYPYLAAVGSNVITYTYTDANTCTNSLSQTVLVNGLPVVNFTGLSGTYCEDDNTPVSLNGFPAGGTYTGPGISGNNFVPSIAGAGFHQITYAYQDGNGCVNQETQSIHVSGLPLITLTNLAPTYCIDDTTEILNGFPSGGSFSGPGVTGSNFNPQNAGTGTHSISYTYINGYGCQNTVSVQTIVYPSPIVSISGLQSEYCQNSAPISLTGIPSGGTFSGTGVSNNTFYPSITGIGNQTITYTYTNANNCSNYSNQNVNVIPSPDVNLVLPFYEICSDNNVILLNGGTPTGGTYSGPGVSGNELNPSIAGIGFHYITYTYTNSSNCTDNDSAYVLITQAPIAYAGEDIDICANTQTTLSATGGDFYIWSTTETTPEISISPSYTTTYTVTVYNSSNNCTATDDVIITVTPVPEVELTIDGQSNLLNFGQYVTFIANPTTYDNYDFYINNMLVQSSLLNTYSTNVIFNDTLISVIPMHDNCVGEPYFLHLNIKPISNAFTPNGDSKNDRFMAGYDLTIMNRWEQVLYQGFDGWDGTFNNISVVEGTYFYIIRFTDSNNDIIIKKGSVTLIREK